MTTSRSCLGSCLVGVGILALLALLMLVNSAYGGEAYCDACLGDSGWNPMAKLDEIGNPNAGKSEVMPGLSTAQKNRVGVWKQPLAGFNKTNEADESNSPQEIAPANNTTENVAKKTQTRKIAEENMSIVRSAKALNMLAPINEATGSAILLDISENATQHITGSIAIPYTQFLINGTYLRSEEEMTKLLGDAGISQGDSVIIYGECMPCGGGPSPATFVYWIMRSLGQENVRVLDGTVNDWASAGKPTAAETAILPAKIYTPQVNPDFSADYNLVKSGTVQIVDARDMQDFGAGSIPGAIPIPYENVIINSKIRDETRLDRVFAFLDKNQPVVVYTNTGVKASVVWFALTLQGYDAKLYSYANYWDNQMASGKADAINSTA
ncbi:MAG: putative thiosulfate sulfurtransferase [Euryarchaeota archaeon]|nr:putative thiosulfate sulfurtransferase [Euryarchaeota archaeon]